MDLIASLTTLHPLPAASPTDAYRLSILGDVKAIRAAATANPSKFPIALQVEENKYRLQGELYSLISPCLLDFAKEVYVFGVTQFKEIIYSLPVQPMAPLTYSIDSNPVPHYGSEMMRVFKSPTWIQVASSKPSFITNRNNGSVVHYLDGMDQISLKANLPLQSKFSIPTHVLTDDRLDAISVDVETTGNWFVKPSHPYIGSGRMIMYGSLAKIRDEYRKRQRILKVGRKEFPIDTWVLQPEIKPMLWEGRKWDARFYAVAIYRDHHILVVSFDKGFGRSCVNPYTAGDSKTTISNISVQETCSGYDAGKYQFLIEDQASTFNAVVADCFTRNRANFAPDDSMGMIILGFDLMYSASGKAYLIEVNHEPALNPNVDTVEGRCARIVWDTLSTTLLPLLSSSERFDIARTLPVQMALPFAHIAAQITTR